MRPNDWVRLAVAGHKRQTTMFLTTDLDDIPRGTRRGHSLTVQCTLLDISLNDWKKISETIIWFPEPCLTVAYGVILAILFEINNLKAMIRNRTLI